MGSVIEERGNRIKGDLALAEELRRDTQFALARYNQDLADARSKASDTVKDMRQRLQLDVAKERARIEAEIAARISDAENQIAAAKARALASVGEIASGLAYAACPANIAATTTTTGLKVEAVLDTAVYEKGIKIRDAEMKRLNIRGDAFHPEWNYAVIPRKT